MFVFRICLIPETWIYGKPLFLVSVWRFIMVMCTNLLSPCFFFTNCFYEWWINILSVQYMSCCVCYTNTFLCHLQILVWCWWITRGPTGPQPGTTVHGFTQTVVTTQIFHPHSLIDRIDGVSYWLQSVSCQVEACPQCVLSNSPHHFTFQFLLASTPLQWNLGILDRVFLQNRSYRELKLCHCHSWSDQ